jgi:hypothetical protein
MAIQMVKESRVYKSAVRNIVPGDTHINMIPSWYTKEQRKNHLHFWSVRNRIAFLRQNLARANNRSNAQSITVTLDELWELGEQQGWVCSYLGIPLEFERGGDFGSGTNPNSCTIDRIDHTKGYVLGNIQLITWQANCAKNALTHNQFIKLCKMVAKRY